MNCKGRGSSVANKQASELSQSCFCGNCSGAVASHPSTANLFQKDFLGESHEKALFERKQNQKYPQYCWVFHDPGYSMTGSERPSPEPLLKKKCPQPYWGGDNSGNALEPPNAFNYRVWGIPAVLSRGIPGKALRAFPEFFRNFFRKVPAVLGVWPTKGRFRKRVALANVPSFL